MTEQECLEAINSGAAAVNLKADILLLGEMGIGNSTVSSALCLGTFGGVGSDWVGAGTGSDSEGIIKKAKVIERARDVNQEKLNTPFQILMSLGGREQAAICGALIAARLNRIPVIIDGFIASSAIAPLISVEEIYDHVIVAHQSAEAGHGRLLNKLGKVPMFDLGMRLGEGSGAALALNIIRASLACHNGMATFAETGIGS
jgi:nicotinate-nucleotide--dimethylbenzimidazole phosphoribosyltransferase